MTRPRVYRAEAIVLRRTNLGEADKLLVLLTRASGKVRVVARGARRPGSRFGGNLELFSLVDILLARGRELDVVTQAESRESYRHLREDLLATSYAFSLAEITDLLLAERDDAQPVFRQLQLALRALDRGQATDLVGGHYLLAVLRQVGYGPELFACLICQEPLTPVTNFLALEQGGVLCPPCSAQRGEARPIDAEVLKVLRHLARTEDPADLHPRLPVSTVAECERLIRAFAEYHLERRLRTPEFIARVRDAARGSSTAAGLV
ncbi:MAG: DNA repair protein RecO [Chloroflexi bacterium]|nr:DNA repair protein RecO [Chloroflexota bacterium]